MTKKRTYESSRKFSRKISLSDLILEAIFPVACISCAKQSSSICPSCLKRQEIPELFCLVCSRKNFLGLTCHSCKKNKSPDRLVVPFAYRGSVKALIRKAKYEDCYRDLQELADALADELRQFIAGQNFVITAVPLSPRRLRERGFNQAEIIAKRVAYCLDVEYKRLLTRIDREQTQVELKDKVSRSENIKGVFSLSDKVFGQNLVLIDDVVTTGATFLEASKTLRKAHKEKIICAALAH